MGCTLQGRGSRRHQVGHQGQEPLGVPLHHLQALGRERGRAAATSSRTRSMLPRMEFSGLLNSCETFETSSSLAARASTQPGDIGVDDHRTAESAVLAHHRPGRGGHSALVLLRRRSRRDSQRRIHPAIARRIGRFSAGSGVTLSWREDQLVPLRRAAPDTRMTGVLLEVSSADCLSAGAHRFESTATIPTSVASRIVCSSLSRSRACVQAGRGVPCPFPAVAAAASACGRWRSGWRGTRPAS